MYEEIKRKLKNAEKIVFFTGAGMSTESGIPDFRSKQGLYRDRYFNGYPPEHILSRSFFSEYPQIFYNFYFEKILHAGANPNDGHKAIALLESKGFEVTVITQNIDGLHTKAGSSAVIELHGSVYRNYCTKCNKRFKLEYLESFKPDIPLCDECSNIVRPDVILYEEPLDQELFARAVSRIAGADILFAIGSSLTVFPAAGLLDYFKGEMLVIINRDTTGYDKKADFIINESCGTVLKDLTGY